MSMTDPGVESIPGHSPPRRSGDQSQPTLNFIQLSHCLLRLFEGMFVEAIIITGKTGSATAQFGESPDSVPRTPSAKLLMIRPATMQEETIALEEKAAAHIARPDWDLPNLGPVLSSLVQIGVLERIEP